LYGAVAFFTVITSDVFRDPDDYMKLEPLPEGMRGKLMLWAMLAYVLRLLRMGAASAMGVPFPGNEDAGVGEASETSSCKPGEKARLEFSVPYWLSAQFILYPFTPN
jgi:hypothetical protein